MRIVALLCPIIVSACFCLDGINERPMNFSIELLYFTQLETNGHVALSPFGIWSLLTCITFGTIENSSSQLQRALSIPMDTQKFLKNYKTFTNLVLPKNPNGVSLLSKSYVFIDNDIAEKFKFRCSRNDYDVILNFQNPSTAKLANLYMKNVGGIVFDVLRSDDFIDPKSIILVNAVYFKGFWSLPIDKSNTVLEPFYNEDNQVIGNVNMMTIRDYFTISKLEALKSSAVELLFGKKKDYSMLIILPESSVKIKDVFESLCNFSLHDVVKKLQEDYKKSGTDDVEVKIPRFHIRTNSALNKPLNDLGVYDIFEPHLATFGYNFTKGIYITTVINHVDIDVTESSIDNPDPVRWPIFIESSYIEFSANKPFLYFIMHKPTRTTVISGIYSKPTVY